MADFDDALRKKLRVHMNNYADDLANGVCKNFEEYKFLCGKIEGLALAERELLDLAKLQEQADE